MHGVIIIDRFAYSIGALHRRCCCSDFEYALRKNASHLNDIARKSSFACDTRRPARHSIDSTHTKKKRRS